MHLKHSFTFILIALLPLTTTGQTLFIGDGATVHVGEGMGTVLYMDGNLENNGKLVNNGGIEINGDAYLADTLSFWIGGTTVGADYHTLFVGDTSNQVGGTLDVLFSNGFTPSLGDEFTVLDAGSLNGLFTNLNLPALGGSMYWEANYSPVNGVLQLRVSTLLPVELLNFQVDRIGSQASIGWTTASEINLNHFEVEHATDGINFSNIGAVKAKGSSSSELGYTFLHNLPSKGANYYRLKIVDYDGNFEFSPIRSIIFDGDFSVPTIQVYPIPADEILYVNPSIPNKFTVELINSAGQCSKFAENLKELKTSLLTSGNYFLRVVDLENKQVWKLPVIIQH